MTIDVLGTEKDGSFIANIRFEGKAFYVYYPAHLGNEVVLCEIPDLVTRFVVFYENNAKLHDNCKKTLMREYLQVSDLYHTGLEGLFRKAMASARIQEKNDGKKNA